ncbi:MAG: hypothetical protein MHM6MM_000492 [Cercozoa sp. M6MM]
MDVHVLRASSQLWQQLVKSQDQEQLPQVVSLNNAENYDADLPHAVVPALDPVARGEAIGSAGSGDVDEHEIDFAACLLQEAAQLPHYGTWLQKKSPARLKGWQQRYVSVCQFNLFYSKDPHDAQAEPQTLIDANVWAVPLEVTQSITPDATRADQFQVEARDGKNKRLRVYQFRAPSQEERDRFVRILEQHRALLLRLTKSPAVCMRTLVPRSYSSRASTSSSMGGMQVPVGGRARSATVAPETDPDSVDGEKEMLQAKMRAMAPSIRDSLRYHALRRALRLDGELSAALGAIQRELIPQLQAALSHESSDYELPVDVSPLDAHCAAIRTASEDLSRALQQVLRRDTSGDAWADGSESTRLVAPVRAVFGAVRDLCVDAVAVSQTLRALDELAADDKHKRLRKVLSQWRSFVPSDGSFCTSAPPLLLQFNNTPELVGSGESTLCSASGKSDIARPFEMEALLDFPLQHSLRLLSLLRLFADLTSPQRADFKSTMALLREAQERVVAAASAVSLSPERLTTLLHRPRPAGVASSPAAECELCGRAFGWKLRRHTCKFCLRSSCSTCASLKLPTLDDGFLTEQRRRACDMCTAGFIAVHERNDFWRPSNRAQAIRIGALTLVARSMLKARECALELEES